jgi:hypothetical protein
LLFVQSSKGAIAQSAIVYHLAALETKITQACQAELALRMQGLRGCKKNEQRQGDGHSGKRFHGDHFCDLFEGTSIPGEKQE